MSLYTLYINTLGNNVIDTEQLIRKIISFYSYKMNKFLALILIPCLVAFVVAQYPGYGTPGYGMAGYGSGSGLSNYYYNYGNQQQKQSSNFALLISGLLLLFAFNITGTLTG
ncbi:hypothetical protein KP79_PYT17354 [Mizuhopecten yessoensis]|uniref:Uncharacterized protein n=1 Tax=Mizuhopecten yessoensis TaxID=6573 RepID=A0A210PYB2_MIZYE|nr:hypothetical protein KP79_PYT17354 [Mizuhopecten yessoensis]